MRFGHAEGVFGTLRFQLTFWNTGVLVLIMMGTLAGLRTALALTLQGELDRLLREDATEVSLLLKDLPTNPQLVQEALDRKAHSHTEDGWFVQVFSADGEILMATRSTLPATDPPSFESPRRTFTANHSRVVQRKVSVPGGKPRVVRVGASLKNVHGDVDRLTRIILATGAIILLVAPLLGYWLAGRATRPLGTILKTTKQLRPGQLDERLPRSGSGDELDRLSATINGLLDRLAEHLTRQRDFITNAAHELRSPLTALRTAAEVALDQERSPEEYREVLADMVEECESLSVLVNQLFVLAEGDAGRLQPGNQQVRLDQLVARSVDMFQGVAEHQGVELVADSLERCEVWGNGAQVRQVVHNLIDNAIKFTPTGGRVRLDVGACVATDGQPPQAILRVRDSGTGIPAEDLPHVFERFYRADKSRHRDSTPGNNGLGLSICQTIVNAYGGQIDIDSAIGVGTTVTVRLPLCPPGDAA
jgi:heavy metal sensor kinase